MIVRFGGGNSGIAEYLEKGRKADRDYSREEMDHRLILSGDLSLTDTIIDSIENKGQERYLHITLSFHETEISRETLQAVTDEYKSLLMNAYHDDEYSFYAEAHLPKLTHIADNKTGELIERKPHIHIVIPRTNLVTGKSLNPTGDITHKTTQERLDAIQEHINNKYGLASPKDGVRVSDENHAAVLSRTKGDLFREKNNQKKNEIFRRLDKENVRTVKEFGAMLAEYGEVRTRNAGKPTEYFAVKFGNDAKFTNLKNPLFSRTYIEDRRLPLTRPSEAQIASRLEGWKNQTSHEIKHVFSKGEKLREHYKSLTQNDKTVFLQERISRYDREHQIESGHSSEPGGRPARNEPGSAESARKHSAENGVRLSRLSERTLVYGIPGRGRNETPETDKLLQSASRNSLGEQQENRERHAEKLRWADGAGRRVGETNIASSSAATDILLRHIERHKELTESENFAQIKRDIEPERFLSYLKDKYNLNPADHKISFASDGSPRFRSDKRNLNASDFLTKKMNLSWDEAKIILTDIYNQQLQNKSYSTLNSNKRLSPESAAERRKSLTEARNEIRGWVSQERKELFAQIKEMRAQLREIPAHQRSLAEGVIVYKKLTGLETIKEKEKESRNAISQYHSHWHERSESMYALDKLKETLNSDSEDGIKPESPRHNLKHAVEAQLHVQNMRNDNQQLKDLVMDKGRTGVDYRDMNTQQVVFSDKGNHVVAGKNPSDKEIGLMMDYAKEKYGGVLKLTGSDDFKTRCATVAAENGLNVILKPSEYHEQMLNKRQEIDLAKQNAVQATAADATGAAPQTATAAAQDGVEPVSKEQLRQAVETLPDVTTPSQLKAAVEAATAAAAASSGAEASAEPQTLPEAATDAQEMSRDQLRAAVESLPERVSPSQLRDALAAAATTAAAADTQSATAAPSEAGDTLADNAEATASQIQAEPAIQPVAAAPETAPDEALRAAVESLPDSVSPTELKQAVDTVNQEHNAQASLRGIREISTEAISAVNASILEKEAIAGTAGVSRDYETGTYDVLIAGRDANGDDEVYTLATVKSSEEATRLATLVNNQEPGQLAQAMRTEIANEHAQSAEAVKYGYTPAEAGAMAAVADINKEVPGASLSASSLKDFHAGHFTVEKTDPFSNASTFEVVGATKEHAADEQAGDVRLATYDNEEQARAVVYSLNGVNTDALSSALDKQAGYEAVRSYDQLVKGVRDVDFVESLPDDIDAEQVAYKEIAPGTWNIEVPDSTGEGHILLGGFKGNEDYARAVMDKVTRIDLAALSHGLEHKASQEQAHQQHNANEASHAAGKEQEQHKQSDMGME